MNRILVVVMVVACGKVNTPENQQTCDSPESLCGTSCVNEQNDPANCGACGTACDSTQACSAGHCVTTCDEGLTVCPTGCVDEQTDPMNCGACGSACEATCTAGKCPLGYFALTGTPDPSTVFNTIAETYAFPNNLNNTIWHRQSNKLLTGSYATAGYWYFPETTTNYPTTPENATADLHKHMVLVPATNSVVYMSNAGLGPGVASSVMVATIDSTGTLSTGVAAVFSDDFAGTCQLFSASGTQLLCYDGAVIRRYKTTAGMPTLTFVDTIPLSVALPATAMCPSVCYGGTFAFDGMFYYFATMSGAMMGVAYLVYDVHGTYVNSYTATGTGQINSAYFDWSVGRYSTHDGYGIRVGGATYASTAGLGDDTHAFSAVSSAHTLQ